MSSASSTPKPTRSAKRREVLHRSHRSPHQRHSGLHRHPRAGPRRLRGQTHHREQQLRPKPKDPRRPCGTPSLKRRPTSTRNSASSRRSSIPCRRLPSRTSLLARWPIDATIHITQTLKRFIAMMHYVRSAIKGPLRYAFSRQYVKASDIPENLDRKKLNLFQAVNNALDIALATDQRYAHPST